ncbi:GP41 [Erinnyis ello granulovirus]|uniref:gp41 n=1 Tax=Erinnyis ello granulovirus TaxID=307444 RepID=A0A097DAR6_9BBAC|nr:GP41 [Erinnyis ello granulovirus]AIS92095.1 GP41 [Erinnyis ello granulovirus]ARX71435.1 gp41 [Erinnyis ello granulovirus]ARX71565.1 gp41 [Erinnyis ello granulovirus]ARX71695.1 gp41 [Erinnyis ello granulovirus]ARX71825.1 gp41 [Erinnyis ello granulovirus]
METLNWSSVVNAINLYRSNNIAKLSAQQIECINLVRDLFVKADPVPVNVTKRFENDEDLIGYYANLEKKYGTIKPNGSHGIFDKSFTISPIMKAYADKFYKRRLSLAACHLSEIFKYQMATAITQNKSLPLLYTDTTHEYLQLLYQKGDVGGVYSQQPSVCADVMNRLVEDVLFGKHNGYYINNCLSANNKNSVYRFRDNITFLLNSPLTLSTNIFDLIETRAVANGQSSLVDYSSLQVTTPLTIPLQQHLSELAFENEALRRSKIQEMNIKYAHLNT